MKEFLSNKFNLNTKLLFVKTLNLKENEYRKFLEMYLYE